MEENKPKKQTMRYSDAELDLIKSTFADNDILIRAIQKVFLQLPLNAVEMATLQTNMKGEMLKILRKTFIPKLEDDVPVKEVWDLWLGMDLKNKMVEDVVLMVKSNKIFLDYFEQQMKILEKGDYKKGKILFADLIDNKDKIDSDIYKDIYARNTIFANLQGRLNQLVVLAGTIEETSEQREKRLERDSSK